MNEYVVCGSAIWCDRHMAHIIKRKNREKKHYVYLVEGYRVGDKVKQRTLKSYGQLEEMEKKEPGIYERLRQEAKDGIIGKKQEDRLVVTYNLDTPITSDDMNYGWKLLDSLYQFLGITQIVKEAINKTKANLDVNKALKLLVFQRMMKP